MILHTVLRCLEGKESRIFRCSQNGLAVLELCQNLIRNQEANEIFQQGFFFVIEFRVFGWQFHFLSWVLELRAVLNVIENSHDDSDIRQRAWMLRSLITHVNTESVGLNWANKYKKSHNKLIFLHQLKDAFNVDMDLSTIGHIEETLAPLIAINVLLDNRPNETYSSTHHSIFPPCEIVSLRKRIILF